MHTHTRTRGVPGGAPQQREQWLPLAHTTEEAGLPWHTRASPALLSPPQLLDLATLRFQAMHDLSGSRVAAITAVRYRPDGHGGMSNVAYMAQVGAIVGQL